MTVAPHRAPLIFADLDAALTALRQRGLRVSAARRAVLERLFAAEGPLSAEEIAHGGPETAERVDLASVYRNLEALEELGLVGHVHLGHGPGRYALASEGEQEYLVCERCDAVRSAAPAELEGVRRDIEGRFGYRARFGHFPIVGLCPRCVAAADANAPS